MDVKEHINTFTASHLCKSLSFIFHFSRNLLTSSPTAMRPKRLYPNLLFAGVDGATLAIMVCAEGSRSLGDSWCVTAIMWPAVGTTTSV